MVVCTVQLRCDKLCIYHDRVIENELYYIRMRYVYPISISILIRYTSTEITSGLFRMIKGILFLSFQRKKKSLKISNEIRTILSRWINRDRTSNLYHFLFLFLGNKVWDHADAITNHHRPSNSLLFISIKCVWLTMMTWCDVILTK